MIKKVLIADDDMTVLMAARIFLEGHGYDVMTATNGNEATKIIREKKPDFALLDIQMPGKSGFEVCKDIKEDKELSGTKIIIFSGVIPEIERGFDFGADDCLSKPIDWKSLIGRLSQLEHGAQQA